jgi:hypothetical protein
MEARRTLRLYQPIPLKMASDLGSFAYNGSEMAVEEQPQAVFYLDLMKVLRAFGDRQREMLSVVRRLRLDENPPPVTPRPTVIVPPPAVEANPVAVLPPSESVSAPDDQPAGPLDIADLVLRTRRRYDYFEDLEVQLSRLKKDPDPDTA